MSDLRLQYKSGKNINGYLHKLYHSPNDAPKRILTECLFNTMFVLPATCRQRFTIYFLPISQASQPIRAGTGVGALQMGTGAQPCTPVASIPATASRDAGTSRCPGRDGHGSLLCLPQVREPGPQNWEDVGGIQKDIYPQNSALTYPQLRKHAPGTHQLKVKIWSKQLTVLTK